MEKLTNLFTSRKFWALIATLVTLATAYQSGAINGTDGVNALVAALAAYSLATGIEDSGAYEWTSGTEDSGEYKE